MNLIERIARLIDAEGAYGAAYDGTGPDAEEIAPTTRQKYFRAKYEHQATEIAKMVLAAGSEQLRVDLIDHEVAGWESLGIAHPELRKMVESKHAE